jgi:hypothetical protein
MSEQDTKETRTAEPLDEWALDERVEIMLGKLRYDLAGDQTRAMVECDETMLRTFVRAALRVSHDAYGAVTPGTTGTRGGVEAGDGTLCRAARERVNELTTCESRAFMPEPGALYRFTVDPSCAECISVAREWADAVGAPDTTTPRGVVRDADEGACEFGSGIFCPECELGEMRSVLMPDGHEVRTCAECDTVVVACPSPALRGTPAPTGGAHAAEDVLVRALRDINENYDHENEERRDICRACIAKDALDAYAAARRAPTGGAHAAKRDEDAGLDTAVLEALDDDENLWYLIRPGRNMIGVRTGGWLWSRTHGGGEQHAMTLREAVVALCAALGKPLHPAPIQRAPTGERAGGETRWAAYVAGWLDGATRTTAATHYEQLRAEAEAQACRYCAARAATPAREGGA